MEYMAQFCLDDTTFLKKENPVIIWKPIFSFQQQNIYYFLTITWYENKTYLEYHLIFNYTSQLKNHYLTV